MSKFPDARKRDLDLGLTDNQVRETLRLFRMSWVDFQAWMRGQTAAVDSFGRVRYYRTDVLRFLTRGGPSAPVLD